MTGGRVIGTFRGVGSVGHAVFVVETGVFRCAAPVARVRVVHAIERDRRRAVAGRPTIEVDHAISTEAEVRSVGRRVGSAVAHSIRAI